jgi:hypothetical protein
VVPAYLYCEKQDLVSFEVVNLPCSNRSIAVPVPVCAGVYGHSS